MRRRRRRAVAHYLPSLLECPSISPSGSTADSARRSIGYRRTVCGSSAQARTLWCGTLQRCELAGGMRAGGRPRESTPRESSESIGLMMSTASHLRLQCAYQHSCECSATLGCREHEALGRNSIAARCAFALACMRIMRAPCARVCARGSVRARLCVRARVRAHARVCVHTHPRVCACVRMHACVCTRVRARVCTLCARVCNHYSVCSSPLL